MPIHINAKEEDIGTAGVDEYYLAYTVRLRAHYGSIEAPTPTHLNWYSNLRDEDGGSLEISKFTTTGEGVTESENGLVKIRYATVGSFGDIALQYSGLYNVSNNPLSQSKGALYFNGHKETYYSQRVLPGNSLAIPGRHVAEDGTVRDAEGYICVAADYSYLSYGTVVMTSLGPGKVYDTGCASGTVDIYVSW